MVEVFGNLWVGVDLEDSQEDRNGIMPAEVILDQELVFAARDVIDSDIGDDACLDNADFEQLMAEVALLSNELLGEIVDSDALENLAGTEDCIFDCDDCPPWDEIYALAFPGWGSSAAFPVLFDFTV